MKEIFIKISCLKTRLVYTKHTGGSVLNNMRFTVEFVYNEQACNEIRLITK